MATMLRSVASMGNVMLLLGLIPYVYGVLGVNLFIAVVISNREAAKRAEAGAVSAPSHSLAEIRARLDDLEAGLGAARRENP